MMQLIQLLLALSLIVGAFLGGLWLGWWRWGRPAEKRADGSAPRLSRPGTLFSPADRDDEVVLADLRSCTPNAVPPGAPLVFGTDHGEGAVRTGGLEPPAPPVHSGGPWAPAAAIDPPPATFGVPGRAEP